MSFQKFINSLKLRTKFMLPISVLVISSVFAISSYLIKSQNENMRTDLEDKGIMMLKIVSTSAESGVLFESEYELNELLERVTQFNDITYAAIFRPDNSLLAEAGIWDDSNIESISPFIDEDIIHEKNIDSLVIGKNGKEFLKMSHDITTLINTLNREILGIRAGNDIKNQSQVVETIGKLIIVISLENLNKSIYESKKTAIVITLIVLLLTIIMIAFFIDLVISPIKQLVSVAEKVKMGDLSQKADLNQSDEIGHLADTFDNMVESLRETRDEIEEYNRNLEQKIIERTLELEEVQVQLIQSEKLSAIGQLAAGVAHELNNPLGGILGYSQFALEKMKKSSENASEPIDHSKFIRYLTDIETQARRCKTIVQNLLRFSRSSKSTDFRRVDMNAVVEDTCTFVEHQLYMNQIELELILSDKLPQIQGDAGQLQQVFTNLIINAMHASPQESVIKIATRFSQSVGEFAGAIEIIVSDKGSGISTENIKKIFEPFFTTKQVGKGTGLGLSVSYGIIKEHGGEIRVDSTVDEGSTFTVILPVQNIVESPINQVSTENQ